MTKTIYIDKEELETFSNSSERLLEGIAYEWEGENVVHIHTKKLPHSYGEPSCVLFTKDNVDYEVHGLYSYTLIPQHYNLTLFISS